MEHGQFQALARAVKTVLKSKGLTYADLGEHIGMSESGLKKLLSAEDGSFGRIESICRVLGIKLLDLIQIAESDSPVREFVLPLDVQEYFIANFDCFRVFWMLMYDELPPEKVQIALAMKEGEFWRHVRQLDRFNLLKVGKGNRITLPRREHLVWAEKGPLIELLRKKWSRHLLEKVLTQPGVDDHFLSLRVFRLTPGSRVELLQDMRKLVREYGHRSLRERLVNSEDQLASIQLMTAYAPGSFGQP